MSHVTSHESVVVSHVTSHEGEFVACVSQSIFL